MNLRRYQRAALAAASLTATLLTGCAGVQQARLVDSHAEARAHQVYDEAPRARPVVMTHKTPWLLGEELRASRPEPAILGKSVVYESSQSRSLSELGAWIVSRVGVSAVIDPSALVAPKGASPAAAGPNTVSVRSVLPSPLISLPGSAVPMVSARAHAASGVGAIHYVGSLRGFLNLIAAKYGVYWRYVDGQVTIFRTETRTFELPSLPREASMTGGIGTGTGGGVASSSGSTSQSSTSSTSSAAAPGGGTSSSTTEDSINYFSGLQKTASAVAGSGAVVVVDPSFGTITVTGSPEQIERVADWVKQISVELSKQVAIEVHVYNVQVSREDNYGLNLALALKSQGGHTGISLQSAAAPQITSTSTPMTFGASILGGTLQGSSVAVQALSTLGHVTQVVSRSGVTVNGQLLSLQAARVQAYLASSATTLNGTAGATTTLTPGSVTVGFTGLFLPKVVNGRILLDLNMTLSNLLGIQTFTAGGGSSSASATSIQLPDVQSTTFQQSVSLRPGQTMVLTGYRQHTGSVTNNGVGSPDFAGLGGGVDAQTGDTVLAVVISAKLL